MSSWNLKQLRELIEACGGTERTNSADPFIRTVDGKLRSAWLHFHEARNVYPDYYQQPNVSIVEAMRALLSNGEDRQHFYYARLKYEAHVVGAAQVLHSVSDVLAHLIITALGLGLANDFRLKLQGARKQLPQGALRTAIDRLLGLAEYRYLQDFVNINKHIRLVYAGYHIATPPGEEAKHGVRFQAFEYSGRRHPEKWGEQLFEEFKRVAEAQVAIGHEINIQLSSAAGS